MKIVVCLRRGADGEPGPFDAAAYEAALRIPGGEVTLLSMGTPETADLLRRLTRLGAKNAVLLCDKAFAGADTLATAYALNCALKRLQPELVLCGRQTMIGDTAQTGPMLAYMAGINLITHVMSIGEDLTCTTRTEGAQPITLPALLTVERIHTLRLPRLRSKEGTVEIWSAAEIGADPQKCGLQGSPTRVIKTYENQSGKRKCRFIRPEELQQAIAEGLKKEQQRIAPAPCAQQKLPKVCIVGEAPRSYAETVSEDITCWPLTDADDLAEKIRAFRPNAVLWGSDAASKRIAARVSAMLQLGLCADCTRLETDGTELLMLRPALQGSTIAKIRSTVLPAMATVRTAEQEGKDIVVGIGYGAKDTLPSLLELAKSLNAEVAASRMMVDHGHLPYEQQVGLTGKTLCPAVYLAVGISGAVHHIAGMQNAGTVIAVNPDKNAPIFDYADYGILAKAEELSNF